jgi:hypothetical protein
MYVLTCLTYHQHRVSQSALASWLYRFCLLGRDLNGSQMGSISVFSSVSLKLDAPDLCEEEETKKASPLWACVK